MHPIAKLPSRIQYEYVNAPDCPLLYVHGAWGGINPHGEIEMNLYSESEKMPANSRREVYSDGTLGPEQTSLDDDVKMVVRTFQAKVLLSYQTAKAVLVWLEDRVKAMEMDGSHSQLLLEPDGIEQ